MRTLARLPHVSISFLALASLAAGCSSAATSDPQGTPSASAPARPESPVISSAPSPSEVGPSTKSWAQTISKTPAPSTGCFVASEPDTTWRQVPCGEAPSAPRRIPERLLSQFLAGKEPAPSGTNPPRTPQNVGGGTDPGAQVTGTLKWAQGSFTNEDGGTSESDNNSNATNPGTNSYSLQMNTNLFVTPVCNTPTCRGWEQLVYDPQKQQAYIEFSAVGWASGQNCPPNWTGQYTSGSTNVCYLNTNPVSVPAEAASNLASVAMIGSTNAATNTDTVTMVIGGQSYTNNQTSVLQLYGGGWNFAEFNVFGENNNTQASFNSPTSLEVQVLTESSTATRAAPSCPPSAPNWNTAETNTLSLLGPCCAFGGDQPGIQFLESNTAATIPTCPALTATPSPVPVAVGGQNYVTMSVVGNLVGQTSNASLQPDSCKVVPSGILEASPNNPTTSWFLDVPDTATAGTSLTATATCDIGGPALSIPVSVQSPLLTATPNPLTVAQGDCGTFTAGIPSTLAAYPTTVTVSSNPLPGVLTPLDGTTAVDGVVTFSVCPTLSTPTGSYVVGLTSSGPNLEEANSATTIVEVTSCTPESPTVACTSGQYQFCGNVSLGCGEEYTCAPCGSGTSCSNGVCCPAGTVGSDGNCCPSGEVYYTGIGCRAPCAAGTEPCPIAGGCATPTLCQKLNNGGNGGNCAKTHSCS